MIRVGIVLSIVLDESPDPPLKAPDLVRVAREIEELGYAHIWAPDTLARPGKYTLDPISVLATAAACTSRLEYGTNILQVPLRYPVELAHRLLSLHQISEGRFLFGAGAGSTPGDFSALDLDFDRRFGMMKTSLETMRKLWNGETVGTANLHPRPDAIGGPPTLIGSWSGKWVERAAQEYDGWIASGKNRTWSGLQEAADRFRDAGGKRSVLSTVYADLSGELNLPATSFHRVNLVCRPREAARRLERLEEMGFTDIAVTNIGGEATLKELAGILV